MEMSDGERWTSVKSQPLSLSLSRAFTFASLYPGNQKKPQKTRKNQKMSEHGNPCPIPRKPLRSKCYGNLRNWRKPTKCTRCIRKLLSANYTDIQTKQLRSWLHIALKTSSRFEWAGRNVHSRTVGQYHGLVSLLVMVVVNDFVFINTVKLKDGFPSAFFDFLDIFEEILEGPPTVVVVKVRRCSEATIDVCSETSFNLSRQKIWIENQGIKNRIIPKSIS